MSEKITIGNAELYLGDCREILPTLPHVDALITDPPYGIKRCKGIGGAGMDGTGKYKRKPKTYAGGWDGDRPSAEVFDLMLSAARVHVIWGGNNFSDLLPVGRHWLFWDKLNGMPSYSDGELAWTSVQKVSVKKFTRCISGTASKRDGPRVHPTQKPLDLMAWCIEMAGSPASVLDPFMGSGSTGVACVRKGIRFVGIERDPAYFEIACRRIEEEQQKITLSSASTIETIITSR